MKGRREEGIAGQTRIAVQEEAAVLLRDSSLPHGTCHGEEERKRRREERFTGRTRVLTQSKGSDIMEIMEGDPVDCILTTDQAG